jgi:hypothetical protein
VNTNIHFFQEIVSPLDQFEIRDLFNLNIMNYLYISITNIGFYLTIGTILILLLSFLSTHFDKIGSNK